MRPRLAVLALVVGFALPALAGDDPIDIKLVPKPKKGDAEEISFTIQVTYGGEAEQLSGKLKREIKTVADDLPATEQITIYSGQYLHTQGGGSFSSGMGQSDKTIKRSGKARMASDVLGTNFGGNFKHTKDVGLALQRDPDAVARAIEFDDKLKVDDRWEVEPDELLLHLLGTKAKLGDGAKAVASLDALHVKDGVKEATISLKATLPYTLKDDPDTERKLVITGTLRGPVDGSAPPRKMTLDIVYREGDEKKYAEHTVLERSPVEKDKDDDSKDDDEKKDKKDKGEKTKKKAE